MKFPTTDYPSTISAGRYRIDIERRLRIEEYSGKVELEDLKSIVSAMASDPSWSPEYNGLVDFTGAQLELSSNDVLRLALMLRQEQNRSSGWLVFAVGSSVAYGVVRMLGYWSRNTDRFRIFQSRQEAEDWLDRNVYQQPPRFSETRPAERRESALRSAV
jgi:hypothetical protein